MNITLDLHKNPIYMVINPRIVFYAHARVHTCMLYKLFR